MSLLAGVSAGHLVGVGLHQALVKDVWRLQTGMTIALWELLLEATVVIKKTLLFLLPSVLFIRLQNGAGMDCKCRLAPSVPFHSFPAVVYLARQQALYCGIGASTTGSTI